RSEPDVRGGRHRARSGLLRARALLGLVIGCQILPRLLLAEEGKVFPALATPLPVAHAVPDLVLPGPLLLLQAGDLAERLGPRARGGGRPRPLRGPRPAGATARGPRPAPGTHRPA